MRKVVHKEDIASFILCSTNWGKLLKQQIARLWKNVTCKRCLKMRHGKGKL